MPSFARLRLDTTAPALTWGPVADAIAGEWMTVQYLVDEPSVLQAEVELRDGRVLPMVVQVGQLTVRLPENAPEGAATVRATTRDDVWNEATFSLVVAVSGVGEEVPPPVPGGMPTIRPTLVRDVPSRAGTRSRYGTTAVATSRSRARVVTHYAAPGVRQATPIWRRLQVRTRDDELVVSVRSSSRLRAASRSSSDATDAVVRRGEGPRAEEELILLGII